MTRGRHAETFRVRHGFRTERVHRGRVIRVARCTPGVHENNYRYRFGKDRVRDVNTLHASEDEIKRRKLNFTTKL